MSDVNTMLEQFLSTNTQAAEIRGDIISSGMQIRLTPGQETITPVDGLQTYINPGEKLGLYRFGVRDQGGMPVVSMGVSLFGEEIGVIGPDDERIPFACYTGAPFATWRSWAHILNCEFMNPNMEFVDLIMEALNADNDYVQYYRKPVAGQEPRVRTTEQLIDVEPKGNGMLNRHNNALSLSHLVLTPDERKGPLLTSYEKDGEIIEVPGFTSFFDVMQRNLKVVTEAQSLPADAENRADIQKQASTQLANLTGTDERSPEHYSLRPTVGYFGLQAPAKKENEGDDAYQERLSKMNRFLAGEEMVLFPPRDADTAASGSEAAASYEGGNPFANAETVESEMAPITGDEPDL
jgi:hypothetical protein